MSSIATAYMARGLLAGEQESRRRKREDVTDARATERHDIAMADAEYRQGSRLPAEEVLAEARNNQEWQQYKRQYERDTMQPADEVNAYRKWEQENKRALGELDITAAREDAAARLPPEQRRAAAEAKHAADIAAARAKEAGTPTPDQARAAAAIKQQMDALRLKREELLVDDATYRSASAEQKQKYEQFSRKVEEAIGRYVLSGNADGIKEVYDDIDDGVDVTDVTEAPDGAVSVTFSNGEVAKFKSRREAAGFAYGALLDPATVIGATPQGKGTSARVQEIEWLTSNLGVSPEEAWKMASAAKSDPRALAAKLYQERRNQIERDGAVVTQDESGKFVERMETPEASMAWVEDTMRRINALGDSGSDISGVAGARDGNGDIGSVRPPPPKPGDVRGEFRFLGGDPGDPQSWVPVKQ